MAGRGSAACLAHARARAVACAVACCASASAHAPLCWADTFTGHREEEDYLIYITKRLIICPLSAKADNSQEVLQHKKKLKASVQRLKRDHGDHFLVWNMTRPDAALFDFKEFGEQVLDVANFPLYVPTLHFTFDFCNMIRYWLKQDPLNVAVILYQDCCGYYY